jgi:hypothetical protein
MYKSLLLMGLFVATTWLYAAGNNTITLEGTLVSSVCYTGSPAKPKTNDMGGKKNCGTYCLRQGTPGGLVTKDDKFYILTASSLRLAPYVGRQIRVTGDKVGDEILAVDTAEVRKGGAWQQIITPAKTAEK